MHKDDWNLKVQIGGLILEMSVVWPAPMVNHKRFYLKRLIDQTLMKDAEEPFTKCDPRYLALYQSLIEILELFTDSVESTARFLLPVLVEKHIRDFISISCTE